MLHGQHVLSPGGHLALQLELVDSPQFVDPVGVRVNFTPHPSRCEGTEQRRPQRRDKAQPQQAGILRPYREHHRCRRNQHDGAQHQHPTAPPRQWTLVGAGHGAHRTAQEALEVSRRR
jgi:hypothetical protein